MDIYPELGDSRRLFKRGGIWFKSLKLSGIFAKAQRRALMVVQRAEKRWAPWAEQRPCAEQCAKHFTCTTLINPVVQMWQ